MLEPGSVEAYFMWREANPSKVAELDWWPSNNYGDAGGIHSELLGYVRWCKMKGEEFHNNKGERQSMSKYTVNAISDNGNGYVTQIGEYEDISDITIHVGMYADDVVIEIEEQL